MAPGNKSLQALAMAGLNVEERLIMHFEPAACNSVPQVVFMRATDIQRSEGHNLT
jgi:hypothetical protein